MVAQVQPLTGDGPCSDIELASAIAAGDHDAFRTLMRQHNRLLYRTARSIVKDDSDAEDAVQNAYLLAYRKIGNFRAEAKLSTWLVRIVVNEALECLRKRSRSAHVISLDGRELDDAIESAAEPMNRKPERPEEQLIRADTRRLIESTIDELPSVYRAVFMLRAVEEFSVEETAVALDTAFPFAGARCAGIVARVMAIIASEADALAV